MCIRDRTSVFEQALTGELPADFDRWDLKDHNGWPVAHIAYAAGHLPADFDRWDLINPYYNLVILPEPQETML